MSIDIDALREEFRARVCEQVDVQQQGENRFVVHTPFRYEDGDHFGIVLRREGDDWILTDEASTLMHLSYAINEKDLESGSRFDLIGNSLAGFSVENRGGEFVIPVSEDRFGDALFSFVQAILKVSDVSYLSREIVRSTFLEDFKEFLRKRVPPNRLQFDWFDEHNDPKHHYPVDAHINSMRKPLFVYALPNPPHVKDATISLLKFKTWKIPFRSLGVFEDQESIPAHDVARFTDAIDKAFSSFEGNKLQISEYLEDILGNR
jgi:hypothetical protein